ncbi:YqeB family protein [Streptomyces sp. URMC 123]|uniref:YqeB family protein n=1 Tax=Streptomyces sp. URMC 123 TaxID=3423403 RepID=UPI003F1B8E4E
MGGERVERTETRLRDGAGEPGERSGRQPEQRLVRRPGEQPRRRPEDRPGQRAAERAAGATRRTVLGHTRTDLLMMFAGMPALGAVLGLLLPPGARWLVELPILPMRGLFEFSAGAEEPWQIVAFAAGGLLLGLGCALAAATGAMKLTVTDARLVAERREGTEAVERADVAAVFLDGAELVVLGRDSRHLLRGAHQGSAGAVAAAFRAHGYPWREADPYAGRYRRWVPGAPDVPAEADAVLAARRVALKRRTDKDVRALNDSLERLGYVVRDEGGEQYWRPLVRE